MLELLHKRSYNAKHFDKGNGVFVLEAHAGHIHYKDGEEYKPIDWTLIFDEIKRGWGFSTHSFHPFFPEYSDGWAEFHDKFQDKDQIVKYKPIGTKVKGELIPGDYYNPNFDDNDDNKGVLYRDVFGAGRDYILYNTRSSMVKVATVNNPNECTADAVFEWEVEFPDKELFRVDKKEDAEEMTAKKTKTNTEDGKLVGYKLEKRDGKNVNTNKLTLIGNSKLDGKEWYTYLKSFKAWDSDGNTIEIVARISFIDGKVILKKTIPLEFLKTAVGRVFTDTTTSYYSGTSDSWNRRVSTSSWSSLVTGAGTQNPPIDGSPIYGGFQNSTTTGSWAQIYRSRLSIDTSSFPSGQTISSAELKLFGNLKDDGVADNWGVGVYGLSPSSETTKNVTDYQNSGSTEYATPIPKASFTATDWNTLTFNSTGIAAIVPGGKTHLAIRESEFDAKNVAPTDENSLDFGRFAVVSSQSSSNDPYLSVTYSAGGTNVTVSPTVLSSAISIITPTITAIKNVAITASLLAGVLSAPAPAISAERSVSVSPNVLTSTYSIPSPSVSATRNATVSASVLQPTFSVIQPSVSVSGNVSISASVLSLNYSLNQPGITAEINAISNPVVLAISSSLLEPTITAIIGDAVVYPSILQANITQLSPYVSTIRNIICSPDLVSASVSLSEPQVYFVTTFESRSNVLQLKKRDFDIKLKKRSFIIKHQ